MTLGTATDTRVRDEASTRSEAGLDQPWVVVVWNDPVNLMTYVSYVFQTYFGYSESKARKLMLEVHEQGRSAVATGSREKAERDTVAMHSFGLWATFEKAGSE
ncbi:MULTISPECIES: ATP-dependent Clp protease adapter ClpS [Arthrobacter]|uniref:ATP-dependent Clp protease adapter ClpS n=1 Tax=Arthrobacter TaxID=1663 RepID=UPI000E717873|nr:MULTISPECIES: ATP-dependent Clp protease adapter ClpS [Arthrobacter]MBJ2122037.1 ATP-dependent Clp protease adapter ClpS [Arthrobacter sp. MSA 4-2]RJU03075.1 ATP-dependent Clp protease adapter ClpS [Arthrobacter frigidicola]